MNFENYNGSCSVLNNFEFENENSVTITIKQFIYEHLANRQRKITNISIRKIKQHEKCMEIIYYSDAMNYVFCIIIVTL